MSKRIVIITGGFDPLHSGHLDYIKAASKLGDMLIVGVNSDEWLVRKKGQPFMPIFERQNVISSIKGVDAAWTFDDSDGSGKDVIRQARQNYPDATLIFANGGDRTAKNIPEMDIEDENIEFVFGVGGSNKANSSSWILQEWKAPKTERIWGYYRILHDNGPQVKLKELTVEPGKTLSMQRHFKRSELWFVTEGTATLYTIDQNENYVRCEYNLFDTIHIPVNSWHQLANDTDHPLKIIEIQYGENCIEEDIERKS
jgi:cytidyltransferase-like protein